jgi:hypothetical protein
MFIARRSSWRMLIMRWRIFGRRCLRVRSMRLCEPLILMYFRHRCNPGGRVVTAVLLVFVQTEGLQCAAERKKENHWSEKSPKVKMKLSNLFHSVLFRFYSVFIP